MGGGTSRVTTRGDLKQRLTEQGLAPLKRYGQHFLVDPGITDRLVAVVVQDAAVPRVVEIGPGPGALTGKLLEAGATVLALEIDRGLAHDLSQVWPGPRLVIVVGDALKLDWQQLVDAHLGRGPFTLAGNLPYYITGPLLARLWSSDAPGWSRAVFMLQREAAARLAADPGTPGAGVPSVLIRTVAEIRRLFDIPPTAFFPRPRVWSTVVELSAHDRRGGHDPALWSTVVHAGFSQRRKMLRTTLTRLGESPAWWTRELAWRGIAATRRAETLSMIEWEQVVRIEAVRRKGGTPHVV